MIGLSDDQIKMLSGKRVKEDMDPYYVNIQLKPWFIEIANKLRLTPTKNNGRVGNLEEITDLTAKALAELLKPILKKIWLQQQLGEGGETLGVLQRPDFESMSTREIIQEYLKLSKEK